MSEQKLRIGLSNPIEGIMTGYKLRDKLAIATTHLLYLTYPVVHTLYRKTGVVVFDPRWIIKSYSCKNEFGIFLCPGGRSDFQFSRDWESSAHDILLSISEGTFVDVGANIGIYTVMASKLLRDHGKVIAIEPDPVYFRYLKQNIELNRCRNVEAKNIAAWSESRKLRLHPHRFGVSPVDSSVIYNAGNPDSYEVSGEPLDEILADEPVSVVKVDTEGAESFVFEGLHETLSKDHNMRIVFEALDIVGLRKSCDVLKRYGFEVVKLSEGQSPEGQYLGYGV